MTFEVPRSGPRHENFVAKITKTRIAKPPEGMVAHVQITPGILNDPKAWESPKEYVEYLGEVVFGSYTKVDPPAKTYSVEITDNEFDMTAVTLHADVSPPGQPEAITQAMERRLNAALNFARLSDDERKALDVPLFGPDTGW